MFELFFAAVFVAILIAALSIFRKVFGIFKMANHRLSGYMDSSASMDAVRKEFIIRKLLADDKISDEEAARFRHMQWQQFLLHLEQQRLFTEQMQRDMEMFNEQMQRDMEETNRQFQEQMQRDMEEMNRQQQDQMHQQEMFHHHHFHNF